MNEHDDLTARAGSELVFRGERECLLGFIGNVAAGNKDLLLA